ncbi:hypothetical protein F5I97DRAFT_1834094 [Phlebopus sp. FC_14]|nr:hypothetical protein F5I97DRAFT_1834094 [Phlebopus sp. FC_14]
MSTITRQSESTHVTTDINVLHRRLGHIDHDSIRRMVSRGYVEGVDSITFHHVRQQAAAPLALLHSDIGGPATLGSCSCDTKMVENTSHKTSKHI